MHIGYVIKNILNKKIIYIYIYIYNKMSALLIFGKFIDLLLQLTIVILLSGIYTKVTDPENLKTFLVNNRNYIAIATIIYNILKFIISIYI